MVARHAAADMVTPKAYCTPVGRTSSSVETQGADIGVAQGTDSFVLVPRPLVAAWPTQDSQVATRPVSQAATDDAGEIQLRFSAHTLSMVRFKQTLGIR